MTIKQLIVMTVLLAVGCQQASVSRNEGALAAEDADVKSESDAQLKINTEALLTGATEDVRVDAATIMLFSESATGGQARSTLTGILQSRDNNVQARIAIFKALSRARGIKKPIQEREDFIAPLLAALRAEDSAVARAAAEAALLYQYKETGEQLERIAEDKALVARSRINAIYALKLQLETKAISCLMGLLDDKDPQVASAAGDALRSIGIPANKDPKARKQILTELRDQGMVRFQRDWVVRQEARIGELEKERDLWRKFYLSALDRLYIATTDDAEKGKLLVEHLSNSEPQVRLWAVEKMYQWRLGTQSKLPAEVGSVLVTLVSDRSRDVRLATAKLLSLMGEVNSAERLLEQMKVEDDAQVKVEMLVALGGACQYAFVPNSGIQIAPEVRMQALELAGGYLLDKDASKSQKAAQVIRKLLGPEGLTPEVVDRYLSMLVQRYEQEAGSQDSALRGELLQVMAGLCEQGAYKADCAKRFAPIFEQGVGDQAEAVREAAVQGLVNIDKPRALRMLRRDLVNDRNSAIRKKLISLAAEVGTTDDLVWLFETMGGESNGQAAWQAMLRIFGVSELGLLNEWFEKFSAVRLSSPQAQQPQVKLSAEQWIAFLDVLERKAAAENNGQSLKVARGRLAEVYAGAGQYERAAEYLGLLRQAAQTAEEKEAIVASLLDVYLRWPKVDAAVQIISNCLLEKDLSSDNVIGRTLDSYFSSPGSSDPNAVLAAFAGVEPKVSRPGWEELLKRWAERYRRSGGPGNPAK